jgi:hydrogenase nickel incorporation protein HypB
MKVIELHESVTASNDRDADALREEMKDKGTLLINLMSSSGIREDDASVAEIRTAETGDLGKDVKIAVLEADIDSDVDAKRIESLGAKSIQVHTDGMCHMDAGMTAEALT